MIKHPSEDTRFRVLRALEENPDLSQRGLARDVGISLGGVNYCLRALAEKGQIKIRNFKASDSDHKAGYAYVLTPSGLAERARLTGRFLQRKLAEYEALEAEIAALREEQDEGAKR